MLNEPESESPPTGQSRKVDRLMVIALVAAVLVYVLWRAGSAWWGGTPAAQNAGETPQPQASAQPMARPSPATLDYRTLINDENFHILAGMAYGQAGLIDQALHHQREALRINPKSVSALNNVGYYTFLKKDFAESAAALEQALQLDPASRHARNNLIETYRKAADAAPSEIEKRKYDERRRQLEAAAMPQAPVTAR